MPPGSWCVVKLTIHTVTEHIGKHDGRPHFSVRVNQDNPNHHLWNNHGTWWFHATVHRHGHRKERVRLSLKTKNRQEARHQRDRVLQVLAQPGKEVAV